MKKKKLIEDICLFFSAHPELKISVIEKQMRISQGALYKPIRDGHVPTRHIWPLLRIIAKLGFKSAGYDFEYLEETDSFLITSFTDEVIIKEENEQPIYWLQARRDILSDVTDLG